MILLLLPFLVIAALAAVMFAFGAVVLWLLGFVGGVIGAGVAALVKRMKGNR